jgi:hypothetical protein
LSSTLLKVNVSPSICCFSFFPSKSPCRGMLVQHNVQSECFPFYLLFSLCFSTLPCRGMLVQLQS